jgi:hypothetical protein
MHPIVPVEVFFTIALSSLALFYGVTMGTLVLSAAASVSAVAAEAVRNNKVDDDFLMLAEAAVIMWMLGP